MTGLADVDRFKIFIQICVWQGFRPLITGCPKSMYLLPSVFQTPVENNFEQKKYKCRKWTNNAMEDWQFPFQRSKRIDEEDIYDVFWWCGVEIFRKMYSFCMNYRQVGQAANLQTCYTHSWISDSKFLAKCLHVKFYLKEEKIKLNMTVLSWNHTKVLDIRSTLTYFYAKHLCFWFLV